MAQLGNDCFTPGSDLMTAAEALDLIGTNVAVIARREETGLAAAAGRTLARDLSAPISVPPHDNAAVDGFAFRFADLGTSPTTAFRVVGRAAAGHPWTEAVPAGAAVRIFTGAVMPNDLDTVAMQEDCVVSDGVVAIPKGLPSGANRRRAGEDFAAGAIILCEGQRLRPQDVGLAAAAGFERLPVRSRLRVAVFSTGDEVVDPGTPLRPGAIHDSNRYALMSLLEGVGCTVSDLGILRDTSEAILPALHRAADTHDVVVTSGGVSVGEEDHVRGAVERLGHLHFWRLAIRPGRPLALGQIGNAAFVGIPGNPVAVMVTFLMFVRPLLFQLGGARVPAPHRYPVVADFAYKKKRGRREWLRARIDGGGAEMPRARRFARDGAGILSSMVESDGLIELAEDISHVEPGMVVPFVPYGEVLG